jgi:putative membrane protein|tara:strand:- start:1627 stop:1998 length:372 start_codon:yes stop_codon:yes gene_type:complete
MAGLLYLPRLFVYHSENISKNDLSLTFKVMEYRLYRFIMNPAMMVVWLSGFILSYDNGFDLWLTIKFLLVFLMTIFHIFMKKCLNDFENDKSEYSSKFFRIINEIPTILMIFIIILVVIKPWS